MKAFWKFLVGVVAILVGSVVGFFVVRKKMEDIKLAARKRVLPLQPSLEVEEYRERVAAAVEDIATKEVEATIAAFEKRFGVAK